jgi:hypothetical protein
MKPAHNTGPTRRFRTAELVLGGLVVFTVFVQAILAGQHIAFDAPIFLHGMLGSAVFFFQVAIVVLVFMDKASTELKVTTLVMIAGLFAQIGLGYAARSGGHAINAMHIPLGVALFGLTTWQLALLRAKN